jgi:hypothetical protein
MPSFPLKIQSDKETLLIRHAKALAALRGTSLKQLILSLLEKEIQEAPEFEK